MYLWSTVEYQASCDDSFDPNQKYVVKSFENIETLSVG